MGENNKMKSENGPAGHRHSQASAANSAGHRAGKPRMHCLPNLCEIVWSREHEPRGVRARTEEEGSRYGHFFLDKFCVSLA
jgi:hypothetical protein